MWTYAVPMLKALIVDDEPSTRDTLRDCLGWSDLGFDEVETAKNGADALARTEFFKPDLMVCDVRMPKMNGTELAVKIRSRFPGCGIIFLSGYSDADYLKTAIRVQAAAYLEKPLKIDQLEAAVKTALSEIRKQESFADAEALRRQTLAFALLLDASPRAETFLPPVKLPAAGLVLRLRWKEGSNYPPAARLQEMAKSINAGEIGSDWFCAPLFPDFLVLGLENLTNEKQIEEKAERLLAFLEQSWLLRCNLNLGVGPLVTEARALAASRFMAEKALDAAFFEPDGRLFFSPNEKSVSERPTFNLDRNSIDEIRACVAKGDLCGLESRLLKLGELASKARDSSPESLKATFSASQRLVFEELSLQGQQDSLSALSSKAHAAIMAASRLSQSLQLCLDACKAMMNLRVERNPLDEKLKKVKEAILNSYADPDLGIDQLASKVALSGAYLCTVFKRRYTVTLKDYITDLRLEEAKRKLRESDVKLQALALDVGFRDANYFSTLFKKEVGLNPSEYRRTYTNRN